MVSSTPAIDEQAGLCLGILSDIQLQESVDAH